MDDGRSHGEPLATAVGVVAAASAVSLGLFFAVGGPFGTVNDVGNAATGVLSGCLAWRLRHKLHEDVRTPAIAAAAAGAVVTVVGSALVVSGTTGFLLAGLVSSVGFAGIGAWLIAVNRPGSEERLDRHRRLGVLAGSLMALGVIALPAIPQGIDDMSTAPWWIWVASLGWLGVYVIYPAWAIGLGAATYAPGRTSASTVTTSRSAE